MLYQWSSATFLSPLSLGGVSCLYSRPTLRTVEGDRADETTVNFGFDTFLNKSKNAGRGTPLQATLMREAIA